METVRQRAYGPRYKARAKQMWPKARWVEGKGQYALVLVCDGLTVDLFRTFEQAQRFLHTNNMDGCGYGCVVYVGGDGRRTPKGSSITRDFHYIVDLEKAWPAWQTRKLAAKKKAA
jgi:hypothetical protein